MPQSAANDKTLYNLYQILAKQPADIATRITVASSYLLGKPYLLHALGDGPDGDYDQGPLYGFDAFDCETFVDTVLAIAMAHDGLSFENRINRIRYHNGHVSFITRNHFTDVDWNTNNQKNGYITDITKTMHDKQNQPVYQLAQALIDKPGWYSQFTMDKINLPHLKQDEQQKKLAALIQEGQKQSRHTVHLPYIPFTTLFHGDKPNTYLFNQIPNAAIIEIVRPNWVPANLGTQLTISHLGWAIWDKGQLFFREASSLKQHVIDVPLIDYLQEAKKSPSIKGIHIEMPTYNGAYP